MAGAPAFKLSISRFVQGLEANTDTVARNMASIMAENIIVGGPFSPGTPVDTGFARGSWYPALNGQPIDSGPDADATGRAQRAYGAGRAGDTFELWTNTTYMPPLEYGHSKQAPRGMVRTTMRSAQAIADAAVRGL